MKNNTFVRFRQFCLGALKGLRNTEMQKTGRESKKCNNAKSKSKYVLTPMYPLTKEAIKDRYDKYNEDYFDGVLPKCRFYVIREKSGPFGRYGHSFGRNGQIVGHIWISKQVRWNEEALREVIVHEMIHHYLQAVKGKRGGPFGHNWRFRRECRKMKRRYGLEIHVRCPHLMPLKIQ